MANSRDNNPMENFYCVLQEHIQQASRTVSVAQSFFDQRLKHCQQHVDLRHFLRPLARSMRRLPLAAVSLDESSSTKGSTKGGPKSSKASNKESSKESNKESSKESSKQRDYTPEEYEAARQEIEQMSPEEREELRQAVWVHMLKSKKVMVDNKETDLLSLYEQVMEERAREEYGVDEWKKRGQPASLRAAEELTSMNLNPGDPKRMMLPEDEEKLELTRMGIGICWSKFPIPWLGRVLGKRDFSFALFAKPDVVKQTMQERWSGIDPEQVLSSEEYYRDILCNAPKTELTVMVIPSRDLPLNETVSRLETRLRESLREIDNGVVSEDAEKELGRMRDRFSEWRLGTSGLLKEGKLVGGANWFFSCGSEQQLAVEAITPGPVKDQEHAYVGVFFNPKLTYAFLDMFMGDSCLDPKARRQVGNNMLYFANGFDLDRFSSNPRQYYVEDSEDGLPKRPTDEVSLDPSSFRYSADGRRNVFKGFKGKPKPLARIEAYTTLLAEDGAPADTAGRQGTSFSWSR